MNDTAPFGPLRMKTLTSAEQMNKLVNLLVFLIKFFVAFLGINHFRWISLRFVCWFYVANTQRLTESGFMSFSLV